MDLIKASNDYLQALYQKSQNNFQRGYSEVALRKTLGITPDYAHTVKSYLSEKELLDTTSGFGDNIVITPKGIEWVEAVQTNKAQQKVTGIEIKKQPAALAVPAVEKPEWQRRRRVPLAIRHELLQEINSKCPFCGNLDVRHFHIHHIDENRSNDAYSNLIMVCPTCHSKVTKKDITNKEVKKKKLELSRKLSKLKLGKKKKI